MNPYMYIFVRSDLTHAQQIVQASHAVDELNKKHPHPPGNYMVLCPAKDERDLLRISMWLEDHGIVHEMFHEPDLPGYTAIATQPLKGDQRKPMRKFQILK